MENQGWIHEYIGIIIYSLITRNIPLKDTKTLYHYVAMLLFENKWTRLDIHLHLHLYVPFLCTRVKSPALQDHTTIGRTIGCLKNYCSTTIRIRNR